MTATAEKIRPLPEEELDQAAGTATVQSPAHPAPERAPEKRRALGRGLDSLLPRGPLAGDPLPAASLPGSPGTSGEKKSGWSIAAKAAPAAGSEVVPEIQAQAAPRAASGDTVAEIPLDQIDRNPYQTRISFDEEELKELSQSIKEVGIVQPIVVRPLSEGRYALVLGERRLRASKLAGKTTIRAIVRRVSDQQAAEMTVVENLQRQDLTCMEQANAFAKLSREFGQTQEQIGQRIGLSRESVSNYMRLLKLPENVRQYLQDGSLGFSEARVLLQLGDNAQRISALGTQAVMAKFSVNELQRIVDFELAPPEPRDGQDQGRARWVDPNVRAAQTELEGVLGVRVRITDRKGKGKIVIEYANLSDYDRIVGMLKGTGE
jgi:ParB family chromosome partitioning protein